MKLITVTLFSVLLAVEASNYWRDPGFKTAIPPPNYGSKRRNEEADHIRDMIQRDLDRRMGPIRRARQEPVYRAPSPPPTPKLFNEADPEGEGLPEEVQEEVQTMTVQDQKQVQKVKEDMDALVASIGISAVIGLILSLLRVYLQNMHH